MTPSFCATDNRASSKSRKSSIKWSRIDLRRGSWNAYILNKCTSHNKIPWLSHPNWSLPYFSVNARSNKRSTRLKAVMSHSSCSLNPSLLPHCFTYGFTCFSYLAGTSLEERLDPRKRCPCEQHGWRHSCHHQCQSANHHPIYK